MLLAVNLTIKKGVIMKLINEKEVKKEANSEKHFESKPSSDFVVGFTIGNSWTETKLEELAIDFANDCRLNYTPCFLARDSWIKDSEYYPESDLPIKYYTTSQVFEIFLNERNKK